MGKLAELSPPLAPRARRRRPRRLLLFVHYNRWGDLADYVVYLLQHVRKIFARVVLISNSPLSETARMPLEGLYDDFFQRENTGFDFLAWKEALAREGRARLAAYDSVTLMNDSCFGPLFDLEAVYRRMEAQGADFWGLSNHATAHVDRQSALANNGVIPEHIQSYFLSFGKKTFLSDAFHTFWKNVHCENNIYSVIKKYETQLTPSLTKAGLSASVLLDTAGLEQKFPDKATWEPEVLLAAHVPFLKIKAFFTCKPPENAALFSVLRQHSRYPLRLVHEHLGRHFSPETSIQVMGHGLEEQKQRGKVRDDQRIALHIHAFYPDILRQILIRFPRCARAGVDIFLTTDSEEKAGRIRQLLQQEFPALCVRAVVICENRGRDVWPWLQVAPLLADYDFAGHLHTKKSPTATARFSNLWREELLDCLLGRFTQIRSAFARDPRLGIVIPDIPSAYGFPPSPYSYDSDSDMKTLLPEVWKRLGCRREVDFPHMRMLVFSYGNMFWYRPAALEPMWKASWSSADMPEEPLPANGTLLHALERLPVYVAWERGYDFRIARKTAMPPSGFQSELAFCEYRRLFPTAQAADTKAGILQLLRARMRRQLGRKQG